MTVTKYITKFFLAGPTGASFLKGLIMARINTALLIAQQAAIVADRANFVRQDPAVVKAAKQARADLVQAGRSATTLLQETLASWQRSDRRSR
ncbi:hypothetical protein [Mycobacterium bourgelatii]|uniref:hypothetical protein n=1 Tax=Mycobacterium bourgelatii TaxID=1273442 RepID=UPI001965AEB1|nr:hypothetical protein [Mycobacterium bourgelatii]